MTQNLESSLAQLRHAYTFLAAGKVAEWNQKQFADGLIAPAIVKLEKLQNEIDRLRADLEAARANARHYAGIALAQQNQKDKV